jgi:thioredoxin 1
LSVGDWQGSVAGAFVVSGQGDIWRSDGGDVPSVQGKDFLEESMASELNLQVTDATFAAEVERTPGLVVVDFWATWCGPCRAVAPVIERLAEDYRGRVKVVKLDTDANPATAVRFGIRSIPTILLFRNGEPVDGVIGADPRLRAILDEKITKHAA